MRCIVYVPSMFRVAGASPYDLVPPNLGERKCLIQQSNCCRQLGPRQDHLFTTLSRLAYCWRVQFINAQTASTSLFHLFCYDFYISWDDPSRRGASDLLCFLLTTLRLLSSTNNHLELACCICSNHAGSLELQPKCRNRTCEYFPVAMCSEAVSKQVEQK